MRDCGSLKRAQKGRETCPFRAPNGFNEIRLSALERMAGTTRLELATSAVTVSLIHYFTKLWKVGCRDRARARRCTGGGLPSSPFRYARWVHSSTLATFPEAPR